MAAAIALASALGSCGHVARSNAAFARPAVRAIVTPLLLPLTMPAPQAATRSQLPPTATPPAPAVRATSVPETTARPVAPQAAFAANAPLSLPALRVRPVALPAIAFETLPPAPVAAADSAPVIVDVLLPDRTVTQGESVTGDVIASDNVQSVDVRIAGFTRAMQKIGPGVFSITIVVPRLPFFLRGRTYTVRIVARNATGQSATQSVPVRVRW